jgi:molybdopterin synthase catalytic subunit
MTAADRPMRIRVRLFARQRELAGAREVALDLAAGATIEDAWNAVAARVPAIAAGRPFVRFARNGEYADADQALADGDEVACIPPISGGATDEEPAADRFADPVIRRFELRADPFPPALARELADTIATPGDGAVVVFEGRTRSTPGTPAPGEEAEAARHAGRAVESLEYEALEPLVRRVWDAIADDVAERFGVRRLAIAHRIGDVPLGETSVLVVAAAAHRDAAFAAAHHAIDETKARAPIWKAERFADGHVWIGEPARTENPKERSG